MKIGIGTPGTATTLDGAFVKEYARRADAALGARVLHEQPRRAAALSDVLPSPEERSPPLAGFLSPSDMKLNRRISGFQIDLQWSKSYKVYELYGLRRLPRLPDADYPVVRFTNATPRNPI